MMLKRFLQFPLVRTCAFVFVGAWAGMIAGLLLALFGAGVSFALLRSAFAGVPFVNVFGSYLTISMMLCGLVAAVMSGVVAVRTTVTDEEFWIDDEDEEGECCGGPCGAEGCCKEEPEVVVVQS